MKPAKRAVKLYEQGYRIWRIAKEMNLTETEVAELLVDAGKIPEQMVEARLAKGR